MWEALAAVGSILSAVVIAVTVIFAARQVRVTVDQLEQLRRSTQFDAARTVLLELADPEFLDAYRFIYHELDGKLADETFRRELAEVGLADDGVHKEIVVLRAFDRIGTYVRAGLVDGDIVYASYALRITHCYERLEEVLAIHRSITGTRMWENVEFLYTDCRRWLDEHRVVIDIPAILGRVDAYRTDHAARTAGGA